MKSTELRFNTRARAFGFRLNFMRPARPSAETAAGTLTCRFGRVFHATHRSTGARQISAFGVIRIGTR